jgi:CMP-N,N'-diacetyllegionaminic acid synthase
MQREDSQVLAIVPARGRSKGVPRKNLRLLSGRPLIAYTIEAALASSYISYLIVSTEDGEIADVSRSLGADVPFIRPLELALDHSAQLDVVLHALKRVEGSTGMTYKIVLLLQPTTPLRTTADIDNAVEKLMVTDADSVVSFHQVEQGHPYYMYTMDDDRPRPLLEIPAHITRRQEFPAVFVRNGAIYATRRDVLIQQGTFYGQNMRAYFMPIERSINIDTEFDFAVAELLLERQRAAKEEKSP